MRPYLLLLLLLPLIFHTRFLLIHVPSVLSSAQDFDFFHFVQQWPGSFCSPKRCCLTQKGKPKQDFGIHGLWPSYNNGSYPSDCDSNNPFRSTEVADLTKELETEWPSLNCPSSNFWAYEWNKHGTCSVSVFDQRAYFQAALRLKKQANLLKVLADKEYRIEGIRPDAKTVYGLNRFRDAIKAATGYEPGIDCTTDKSRNSQLYQIYLCADGSGSKFIQCPKLPGGKCGFQIKFPPF
ncbi:hypothetical protein H6P81_011963 [Aristolochia fimbriata]|uniref:Uncharacterized protein n=1 Tax=Aristolochia fimbriata TaxID=158543 RepID=A0AAV7EAF8_ARIFI|nr:hypothetical protein H6P81_011963 [Aristolochia fimbriata]